MANNEFNIEDLVFRDQDRETDRLELPLSRQTFFLAVAAVVLFGLIALGRLGFLNVVKGSFYQNRALANANKEIGLTAPRGLIVDRFGQPLVENKSSFSVFANINDLLKNRESLDDTLGALSRVLGLEKDNLENLIYQADWEKRDSIAMARNISVSQAIILHSLNLPGISIEDDYTRGYIDGLAFSHIVGFTGVSETDNSIAGKAGLEAQYDDFLKGQDGAILVYRDAGGKVLDRKISEKPRPGNQLATTIDAELQKFFYQRLKSGLAALGRDSGVGIAIDPRNAEILAMISLPAFDNNNLSFYLNKPGQPLFNRAISGSYTPGSTIKPLVALAGLHEGLITPTDEVLSKGFIEVPNPYDVGKPSRFLDWKVNGWVNLHSALARSSNIYFYAVGGGLPRSEMGLAQGSIGAKGLGIEKLREYWQKFLLGQKTGIDLPAESKGFLPDVEEKGKRTGQIWHIGDTYNVSIGQGDLLLTPLQLINFISSIANGGKIYKPHFVSNNSTQSSNSALLDYSDWQNELKEVQEGMKDTVRKSYGTANLLSSLPMSAAGKTGSSQVANNTRTNAFFVGYAPADNPQIAILVLIENSREGSLNAVPIAKDVLEWYYENRIKK